jgi:radical SAM superfamily enzyme YgiQ (UPF0313 family)
MVQVNAPYPATAVLAAFLADNGVEARQADASLMLALRLFSAEGLGRAASAMRGRFSRRRTLPESVWNFLRRAEDYSGSVEPVLRFLQGRDPTLALRIESRRFLPEGPRFGAAAAGRSNTGTAAGNDPLTAVHIAGLYLDDISDAVRDGVDARFGLARYGEALAASARSFAPIADALAGRPTMLDSMIDEIADELVREHRPDVLGLTIPFPGNVYGAFRIARRFRTRLPGVRVVIGGGYPSTELRSLSDRRVFDHVDYVVLDDGELPLLRILDHIAGRIRATELVRTFCVSNGRVRLFTGAAEPASGSRPRLARSRAGAPALAGLPLDRYFSMVETHNPMHRLWSCGRWNKMALAHGCYWRRCAFCDVSLDYINRYRPEQPEVLADRIAQLVEETGQSGFHFVDEAMPPSLVKRLAQILIDRRLKITWWGNVRFDAAFTPELAGLMARAGCVAVTGGLEAPTDRLLRLMRKGFTAEQAARVAGSFRDAGLLVHAYLMYGCPSQTAQDTVDSLDFVRQLFVAGCLQSAFWHRFALTVHSPISRDPEAFGIRLLRIPKVSFALNEIPYRDTVRCNHDVLGAGLRRAVFNYMHGIGLNADVAEWFDSRVPRPSIRPDFVAGLLSQDVRGRPCFRH